MIGLYPIIRRKRRPLLPVEDVPAPVTPPVKQAVEPQPAASVGPVTGEDVGPPSDMAVGVKPKAGKKQRESR